MSMTGVFPPVEVILLAVPETLVTVPEVAGAALVQIVPFDVRRFPLAPGADNPVPPSAVTKTFGL
jgi:hypothetical protein